MQREKVFTAICVQCYNMYQLMLVKISDISCLAFIFNLSNPTVTILHANKWFKVAKHDEPYTVFFDRLMRTHDFVVEVSSSKSG